MARGAGCHRGVPPALFVFYRNRSVSRPTDPRQPDTAYRNTRETITWNQALSLFRCYLQAMRIRLDFDASHAATVDAMSGVGIAQAEVVRSRPGTETILRLPLRDAGRGSTRRNTSRATDQSINPARSACGTQRLRKIRCRSLDSHHPGVLRPARTAPVRVALRRVGGASSGDPEQPQHGDVLIHVRPVDSLATTDQTPMRTLGGTGVAQSRKPHQGTDSSRPSASTTWSATSDTETSTAVGSILAEVLIPRLQKRLPVRNYDRVQPGQLMRPVAAG